MIHGNVLWESTFITPKCGKKFRKGRVSLLGGIALRDGPLRCNRQAFSSMLSVFFSTNRPSILFGHLISRRLWLAKPQ